MGGGFLKKLVVPIPKSITALCVIKFRKVCVQNITAPTAVQRWMVMGMARLIDADRLLRDPYFQEDRFPSSHLIRMAVGEQRTVDAVPVVRCKDCKAFVRNSKVNTDRGDCYRYGLDCVRIKKIDDFCSYGERKDND